MAVLPATSIELLIALRYYLQHMVMRGKHRSLAVLLGIFCDNADIRSKYTGHYAEHKSRQKGPFVPSYVHKPVSVTAAGWPEFDEWFRNMLRGILNAKLGAPLTYVIRPPGSPADTPAEHLVD